MGTMYSVWKNSATKRSMMMRAFISIAGSAFLGLIGYELFKMFLYGALTLFVLRALGSDFSLLRQIYDTVGWPGIGAALTLYLLRAIWRVEAHLKKYEDRVLARKEK